MTAAGSAAGPWTATDGTADGTGPVVLTAHPLQRLGAFALAELADAAGPETMTGGQFEVAAAMMADDVVATADVEDAKSAGGFWLGVSYLMWPNSAMNPTARKKLTTGQRRERIRAWRTYPEARLGIPCALCGQAACGFFGKVDVPLGASMEHRNTTPPGHGGLALCKGCLASFHALPYGCRIGGGRASALHSWDDEFLRDTVALQVDRTRRRAAVASDAKGPGPFAREVAALRRLRSYEEELRAGVELYVFSNSNREQVLEAHALEQPLAEWLRATMNDKRAREGFRYLIRAHWTEKIPGLALLARNAFRDPERIVRRAVRYLAGLASESGFPPAETTALAGLCFSFATEVLQVQQRDIDQITELAGRIADLLCTRPERGTLKTYENAHRDSRQLQAYLKREAVAWALQHGRAEPLVTGEQWRLLFDPDGRGWFCQDLLLMSVLQSLAARGWLDGAADDPAARTVRDDDTIFGDKEDQ